MLGCMCRLGEALWVSGNLSPIGGNRFGGFAMHKKYSSGNTGTWKLANLIIITRDVKDCFVWRNGLDTGIQVCYKGAR